MLLNYKDNFGNLGNIALDRVLDDKSTQQSRHISRYRNQGQTVVENVRKFSLEIPSQYLRQTSSKE